MTIDVEKKAVILIVIDYYFYWYDIDYYRLLWGIILSFYNLR